MHICCTVSCNLLRITPHYCKRSQQELPWYPVSRNFIRISFIIVNDLNRDSVSGQLEFTYRISFHYCKRSGQLELKENAIFYWNLFKFYIYWKKILYILTDIWNYCKFGHAKSNWTFDTWKYQMFNQIRHGQIYGCFKYQLKCIIFSFHFMCFKGGFIKNKNVIFSYYLLI